MSKDSENLARAERLKHKLRVGVAVLLSTVGGGVSQAKAENSHPNILSSNQLTQDLVLKNDSTTVKLLCELPSENKDVRTYNIVGVKFTNEDFEGCEIDPISQKMIKRCNNPTKSYRDGICVAAMKQQLFVLIPKDDITKTGRHIIDITVKGKTFDEAVRAGCICNYVSFDVEGQDETFSNIPHFSCQYPKTNGAENYGHLGFRFTDSKTGMQYEYRGTPDKSLVKRSRNKKNPYGKRTVITRLNYLNYALKKHMERGESLFFVDNGNGIIDIYTPETLPQNIAELASKAQNNVDILANGVWAKGQSYMNEKNEATLQITSFTRVSDTTDIAQNDTESAPKNTEAVIRYNPSSKLPQPTYKGTTKQDAIIRKLKEREARRNG